MKPVQPITTDSKRNLLKEAIKIEKKYDCEIVKISFTDYESLKYATLFVLAKPKFSENRKSLKVELIQVCWEDRCIHFCLETKRKLKIYHDEYLYT